MIWSSERGEDQTRSRTREPGGEPSQANPGARAKPVRLKRPASRFSGAGKTGPYVAQGDGAIREGAVLPCPTQHSMDAHGAQCMSTSQQ